MAKPTRTLGTRGVERSYTVDRWNKSQRPYDPTAKYQHDKVLLASYRFGEKLPGIILGIIIVILVIIKVFYG